jgi:drug/metabolite transporter (DMT)-like permease
LGEIIAFISTLGFASANVLARKAALNSSASTSLYGSLLSTIITLVLAVIVYVVLLVTRLEAIINVEGMIWFAAGGFLSVYVGRTFLYYSLEHLDSVSAANIKSLAPFFTVIIAAIFLGEPITMPVWIGGALIFTSLFLISNNKKKTAAVHGSVKRPIFIAGNIGILYGILSSLGYATGIQSANRE